jgi:hypothetical protein
VKVGFFNLFKRKKTKDSKPFRQSERGLLVFENTSEVIRAENILKAEGWKIRVMGPPPEIRTGCDLVIEFSLIDSLNILRLLRNKDLSPLNVAPVTSPLLEPVGLFRTTDFGDYLMVRAANMKLTIDKKTQIIVNVSGGGCPDVPYLAAVLVGKTLYESPKPRELGHTLCGYALDLAGDEMRKKCLS